MKINISPIEEKAQLFDREYIKTYALENKENLMIATLRGTDLKYIVVATVKGWCTCVSLNNGVIIQSWAGDLIIGASNSKIQ